MQGHIPRVGIQLRSVLAANLAEARFVPVAGIRAALAVEAALAVVAAKDVDPKPRGREQ
jgi:hypothetical protein